MDPETKNRICHHISGSSHFVNVLKEVRVHAHRVTQTLEQKHPLIYASLYQQSPDQRSMIYTNPTKPIDVLWPEDEENDEGDDERFQREYVFTCLTIEHSDYNEDYISSYLVSSEYNVSDDITKSHLPGRFIFFNRDYGYIRQVLFAVAEIPARSLLPPGSDVEHWYLQMRVGKEPGKFSHH